jgi:glycogen(starch) synthase
MNAAPVKVLMFGWEFPPNISGGLGTACHGITRGLAELGGIDVDFIIPTRANGEDQAHVRIIALAESAAYLPAGAGGTVRKPYGQDLIEAAHAYAARVPHLIEELGSFDVIHAHDWLTCPAAIKARELSGKPMLLHVHSTEYDRSGVHASAELVRLERQGMDVADRIVAVSDFTRDIIIRRYGQAPAKVVTVHDAADPYARRMPLRPLAARPQVSFLGRITYQKGPAYFVRAAQLVAQRMPEVQFVMAGSGDMLPAMRALAAELGLEQSLYFPGFLAADEVQHLLQRSAVYVMPSVAEPFGISALEAMDAGVPAVLSKQSGVAEVVEHACKVDYWDVPACADAILTLLTDRRYAAAMVRGAHEEIAALTWKNCARALAALYSEMCGSNRIALMTAPERSRALI